MSEPPSRPDTDRKYKEIKCCCGGMPSTSYNTHHCGGRPVSWCNSHYCDKSTFEEHLRNSGSTCCDRSHNRNRNPPHGAHNHERRRSFAVPITGRRPIFLSILRKIGELSFGPGPGIAQGPNQAPLLGRDACFCSMGGGVLPLLFRLLIDATDHPLGPARAALCTID